MEEYRKLAEFEEEDTHEDAQCPMCSGPGNLLGKLGKRVHYRCRNCGMDFNHEEE
jgi:DNA-directed RNA polymerase subunit RPC12/RpoP